MICLRGLLLRGAPCGWWFPSQPLLEHPCLYLHLSIVQPRSKLYLMRISDPVAVCVVMPGGGPRRERIVGLLAQKEPALASLGEKHQTKRSSLYLSHANSLLFAASCRKRRSYWIQASKEYS